ncbi:MAG: DUF3226 domain-containing protein [Pseudomonadota bacterium]
MADANSLLVEGKNDLMVICNILQHHQVPQVFKVLEKGGIDNILEVLPVQLKGSGVRKVGVVIDADLGVQQSWERLAGLLRAAGYAAVPPQPDANGTIVRQEGSPSVGVWIMPNNALTGDLETFLRYLVPNNDQLLPHATRYVESAQPILYLPQYKNKAIIHSWLAIQEDPGKPFGQAITARYLDAGAPEALRFINWIRGLFVE